MPERTKLVVANPTKSLRTTVPAGIARQLGLGSGDFLEWQLAVKDGVMIIEVTPAK